MNKAQSGWTEDRLAKLRELWDKKLSITKIGEELGVSRNAVAGKAHRLGLEKRQSPIKPSIKPKKPKLIRRIISLIFIESKKRFLVLCCHVSDI